ncbi:MAG: hypothetical protein JWN44_1595 [Myxococcales bacterium]|nr:hypothetical protein [Myxococcales bacterium]
MAGGGGSSGSDLAVGGPADLAPRPTAGIACGTMTCTSTAQLCCTADSGKSGTCGPTSAGCGSTGFLCDGPEDCEPANPECCAEPGIAACRPAGYCATKTSIGARLMCHTTPSCTPPTVCMNAPNGSPYALCL